ncbi:L,D-transpeptidase family protein [Streptomyces echinoruber]|uniref:Lipoprotein n=1 Tax=Streptomyces echinoruber TaxID=68898 RepID=A0A918REF5_9ACTN|nr:L,D-transpeptidase family protein [Streptomyces echinoruber]GGZ96762.1 lipoprotein [Streptomyces echinoruber]
MSTRTTPRLALPAASLLLVSGLLTGCGGGAAATVDHADGAHRAGAEAGLRTHDRPERARPGDLPGLGPRTRAAIPADARQVVLVTGRGKHSSDSTVVVHRRTDGGWRAGPSRPAHNALKGWTDHHTAGDLHSPVGVYTLTDAGGLLPDPGSRLPYHRSAGFTALGTGFEGEPLAGAFDYVVAINYNRRPGTSPLDGYRPLGAGRGGGIWFHVDHGGPTHGCVTLSEEHMRDLLTTLDPALHPVVVMGDAASLAR